MLKIEYQFMKLDGRTQNVTAIINADSTASWLSEVVRLYGKVCVTSIVYDKRYD